MQSQLKAERVLIVLEPTGGYEQLLVRFALSTNWDVAFVNPHNFRQWVKGVGVRAKTDKQDALMLATYGASIQPPTWQPMPEDVEILDHLLSRGQELSAMLQQEKNRLHALCHKPVKSVMAAQSVEASIAFIEEQLSQVKSAVEDHFDKNLLLKDQKKHLLSVPGVGQKNVLNLLVTLHRFASVTDGNGSSKALTAFVGLYPVPYQSGTSVSRRPGISKQGNRRMRQYLFLGALGGVRGNNPLKTFYQRLVGRGKPKMVALIACARKILVWSWAIFQQQTSFDATRCGSSASR